MLGGCSEQVLKHGQHFSQGDLQQIQPGMSREQVRLTLGSPSTTTTASSTGGDVYYYISSTAKQAAFFKPSEVDRQVVAVYFNPLGSVERVANYGLKDGKVFAWGEGLNGQVSPPLSFLPAPSLSYSLLLVLSSRLSASWHALAAHALAAHAQRYHVRGAPHAA